MDRKFYLFLCLQFAAAIALLLVLLCLPGPWDTARWVGLILVVLGLTLVFTARFQLGKSFSVTPQARALVSHGLYTKVRNPIYVFGTLVIVGLILLFHRPVLWIVLAVVIPVQILRARKEARVLEEKFGEAYREYRRTTWF